MILLELDMKVFPCLHFLLSFEHVIHTANTNRQQIRLGYPKSQKAGSALTSFDVCWFDNLYKI